MSNLTDEIRSFRALFDGREQTGVQISGPGVAVLRARINTILALASELEEETGRRQTTCLGEPLNAIGDNVVMLIPDSGQQRCPACGKPTHEQEAACLHCGRIKAWAREVDT